MISVKEIICNHTHANEILSNYFSHAMIEMKLANTLLHKKKEYPFWTIIHQFFILFAALIRDRVGYIFLKLQPGSRKITVQPGLKKLKKFMLNSFGSLTLTDIKSLQLPYFAAKTLQ